MTEASSDLPNLGLLIKLLKMTTSANDAEALMAMRKANEQLAKFGGDWESLLRGKVTIIAEPFAEVPLPARNSDFGVPSNAPTTPKRHTPTRPDPLQAAFNSAAWASQPTTAPRPAHTTTPLANKFAGNCWNCGAFVGIGKGFIRREPETKNKWEVFCPSHARGLVNSKRASRRQAASAADLTF